MKFILTVPIALLFTACPYPSHLIRVNESLPKNAPVEKETIVAYAQGDCSSGDCPLENKNNCFHRMIYVFFCQKCWKKKDLVKVLRLNLPEKSSFYDGDTRQIEFYRYGPKSCEPSRLWGDRSRDRYFVVWYKEGVPYRTLMISCDDSTRDLKAVFLSGDESRESPVLRSSDDEFADLVVEVK